jgi:hypothetical protein
LKSGFAVKDDNKARMLARQAGDAAVSGQYPDFLSTSFAAGSAIPKRLYQRVDSITQGDS